ncbi:MAG: LytTR family transcriptional regulator DNA-binding domain-containing protein [Pseudomonadota bacterium]
MLILAYGMILPLSGYLSPGKWLATMISNILPILLCSVATRFLLLRFVFALTPAVQIIVHVLIGLLFSAAWFFLLMVLLGMTNGDGFMTFSVRPFQGPAALWQMMQGATFYALVALLAYVETLRSRDSVSTVSEEAASSQPRRVFVRDGDETRPLDPERIVQVVGAGDYAEIVTLSGKHLIRKTMNELEAMLGPAFLRVHRSHIVNIDRVERLEPAGSGRMTLHLANGDAVMASRSGAKAVRDRTV